ncbi:MAG: hypothetical protein M0035_12235 [Actinomycetota bacterium]|nr:hypothetical protein [Actinomycetota bacterium]
MTIIEAMPTAKPPAKPRKRTPMSPQHKAALAKGREEGRAVRTYLDALQAQKPRRGRRRTKESITKRLATIEAKLPNAESLAKLGLLQERENLQAELRQLSANADLSELEKQFVKVAKEYGERKHIGYAAWKAIGVSPAVLQKAGITRSAKG